jgi:hypothetical protein
MKLPKQKTISNKINSNQKNEIKKLKGYEIKKQFQFYKIIQIKKY